MDYGIEELKANIEEVERIDNALHHPEIFECCNWILQKNSL